VLSPLFGKFALKTCAQLWVMGTRPAHQEATQESAVIEASAAHHNCDLGRFATRCAHRRLSRDREPVIQREGLIRLRDINASVGSLCKNARRELIGANVKAAKDLA
jgi:hypothetical protein